MLEIASSACCILADGGSTTGSPILLKDVAIPAQAALADKHGIFTTVGAFRSDVRVEFQHAESKYLTTHLGAVTGWLPASGGVTAVKGGAPRAIKGAGYYLSWQESKRLLLDSAWQTPAAAAAAVASIDEGLSTQPQSCNVHPATLDSCTQARCKKTF
jgi:hypothetical protein